MSFFRNLFLSKEESLKELLSVLYEVSEEYEPFDEDRRYETFKKSLEKYNIKNLFVDYIHPSYYPAILSAFHDSYELCPALYNKPLEAFGLEENYDFSEDNKIVVGRFVLFHKKR